MIIMGIFSVLLTLAVSLVNQHRWKEHLTASYTRELYLVEDIIVTAVTNADKAFQMLGQGLEEKMRNYSNQLLSKYAENPDVSSWDYQALKRQFEGMDIYILDANQTILYSSFAPDIGLSFRKEDGTLDQFAQLLRDRLNGDQFVSDGFDQETNSGKIRKYSYMPTPDHKYLIELGLYMEAHPIFTSFNFLEVGEELVKKYNNINSITVFNTSGKSIGKMGEDGKTLRIAEENRLFFQKAQTDNRAYEVSRELDGLPVTYRYVPYYVELGGDTARFTDQKIIEIIYNEVELRNNLRQNKQVFLLQFLAAIVVALVTSYFITRLVARPMYLASHDLLTGLSNRAVFENSLISSIEKSQRKGMKTALLLIDLDHFKKVNDTFGHDAGDHVLREVGRRIRSVVPNSADVKARLGGDEFAVILNQMSGEQAAVSVAQRIIQELRHPIEIQGVDIVQAFNTTASVGIAFAPDHGLDYEGLYKCADLALYQSKRTGKNMFTVYHEALRDVSVI